MRIIPKVLQEIAKTFDYHGILNSKRQAEELLCDFLNCSRASLFDNPRRALSDEEWVVLCSWVHRRLQGEPLAYLSGRVKFYGCTLEITPAVLIPRPETEILVDQIAQQLKMQEWHGKVLWDLCCGSGCIGIALKKRFPALMVYLSDKSEEAIALAAHNAAINQVEVTCLKGDLLLPFYGLKAHYVVCNPPYISEEEYQQLEREVKDYEPQLALLGGKMGLEIYERLARELPLYLHPQAQVAFEIGYQQGEAIQKLFQTSPWKKQRLERDWAGHHRFFFLENE